MTCNTCNDNGYITHHTSTDYLDTTYTPCPNCNTPCTKCNNTGYYETHNPLQTNNTKQPCPACWDYKTCPTCNGDGEDKQSAYDPNIGYVKSPLTTCPTCNGHGHICTGWARTDADAPNHKPATYNTTHTPTHTKKP